MGFRFRKSFKIAPGVRVNLNKKSASISVGTKGARITKSTSGRTTTTVGIPGTGISYSQSHTSKRKTSSTVNNASADTLPTDNKRKERVKYPPRKPVAYTPPTEKPMTPDAAPTKKERVEYSPRNPEDHKPPSANPAAKSTPPMPAPQPQPNKPEAAYASLKVLGIILVAFGLFLSIASVIGGFIFTAIGCVILQKRARMIEAATGQAAAPPFRRRWQIVVSAAFVFLSVAGVMTPDPVSKITLNGLISTKLEVPEATSISYTYEPADASTDSITCESSNPAVATVDVTSKENGKITCLITPVSAGDVVITCQTNTAQAPELQMSVTDPAAEAAAKAEAERKAAEEAAAAQAEAERKAAEEAAAAQAEAERKAAEEAAAAQAAAEKAAAEQEAAQEPSSPTVYITPTGARYHNSAKCAGDNAIETTLDEATSQGYTPCGRCA